MNRCASWRQVVCMGLLSAGLTLSSCENMNKKSLDEARAQEEAVAEAVRAEAARLEALRLREEFIRQQAVPEVTWLSDSALHRNETVEAPAQPVKSGANDATTDEQAPPVATSAANMSVEPVANDGVQPPQPVQVDRDDLLTQLLLAQRTQQGDAMARAINISAILGIMGKGTFDPRDLETLSDPQKNRVTHYHQLTSMLREQTLSPGGASHYQSILEHLDAMMEDVPLHIRKVEIARSVRSFGVYEAMETTTFLAGRNQPMIVYVELEHYKSIKGDGDKFAVKLAQELVLYNEADGLAVWREPRVLITDESFNHRRDFFVVQRIELPARLNVGKYILKITMSDLQGGSIDETTVPIAIVADAALVKKP